MSQEPNVKEIAKKVSLSIVMIILYIVIYVIISALIKFFITDLLPKYGIILIEYETYIQILLALAFGYMIVSSVAMFFYWSLRIKYSHSAAVAVRNIVKIIGIGAMIATIAGAVAGGVAGVALGGFIGMVIGFASQQVLGQAIAGLFLLISRPFKVEDSVVIAGEDGIIEDISTLFTVVVKADGVKVFIPNNTIIGSKIYLKPNK